MPIAPTGFINELLAHYGEIYLFGIKDHTETINTTNESQDQEYEQLYTGLIGSLTPEARNTVHLK